MWPKARKTKLVQYILLGIGLCFAFDTILGIVGIHGLFNDFITIIVVSFVLTKFARNTKLFNEEAWKS